MKNKDFIFAYTLPRIVELMELKQERLQWNTVQEGNPSIKTTAGAIKTIIEDPLLPILEEDSNITHSPR
jgi:hypothetical protein